MIRNVQINSYVKMKFFKVKSAGAVGNKMWVGVGNKEIIKSKEQIGPSNSKNENIFYFNRIDDEIIGLEKKTILLTESDKDENSFLIERVEGYLVDIVKYLHSALGLVHYFVNMIRSGNTSILSNWNDEIRLVHIQMKNIKVWIEGNYKENNENIFDKVLTLQKIARDLRLIDILVDIV